MRAIDTNIMLRIILRDDPAQAAIAADIIEEPFLLLPTVVLEAIWFLGSRARKLRLEIVADIREFIGHENAVVQSADVIGWALDRYEEGGDFADMLHVGLAAAADASLFATFDQDVAKFVEVPDLTIETLI